MRPARGTAFRPLLFGLAAIALMLTGCGGDSASSGDEASGSTDLTATGAEDTVRLYLAAVATGNGKVACDLLADDFEATLLEGEQARQLGAETCPDFIVELGERQAQAGEPFAFEGQPLREPADAEALEFRTEVEQALGDSSATSATVRGEQGTIAFRLDAPSGRWQISEIVEGG